MVSVRESPLRNHAALCFPVTGPRTAPAYGQANARSSARWPMNELAELPGRARVNSRFTMKTVKAAGALPV